MAIASGPGTCPSCGQQFPQAGGYCPNDGTRVVAAAPAARDDLVGRTLDGRYEIREVLAPVRAGAIGAMYRGFQLSVSRDVAIKIVHAQYARDDEAVGRFLHAGRQAAQLVAPSIANVYDVNRTADGTVYVVSELARGRPLVEHLGRAMPARRVVGLGLQLADALIAAQRQKVVHGALDPASIVIDEAAVGDQVKLLDIGLAWSLVPPRPGYAAPERLDGNRPDARADIYSVGCILYELLVGAPVFAAASPDAVAGRHRREPPPQLPPHVPPQLATVVLRCLAKSPGDRYATPSDLRTHLLEVQQIVGIAVPRTSSNPGIALPRTSSNDYSNPNLAMPRTSSNDYSNPNLAMPRAPSADYGNSLGPAPGSATPPRSGGSRLLVILLVAAILSGGGIVAILFL